MAAALTTLDYLLLGLLSGGPSSGYDLRTMIGQTPLRGYSDSPGSIYPALRRLETLRCVRAGRPTGGRRRRAYEVTDTGRRAFLEWLARPVERDDVIYRGEELLLRFAFMGPLQMMDLAKRFLEQYERENAAYLETLRRHFADESAGLPATSRLAFELGLEQFRTRVRWARDSLQALNDDQPTRAAGGSP